MVSQNLFVLLANSYVVMPNMALLHDNNNKRSKLIWGNQAMWVPVHPQTEGASTTIKIHLNHSINGQIVHELIFTFSVVFFLFFCLRQS